MHLAESSRCDTFDKFNKLVLFEIQVQLPQEEGSKQTS